jgi:hypothetical protein
MSFGLYALGFLIAIGGLIYGVIWRTSRPLDRRRRYRATRNWHCHRRPKYSAERSFLTAFSSRLLPADFLGQNGRGAPDVNFGAP